MHLPVQETGDVGWIPGLGREILGWEDRSLGGGNGNPLQYSLLENPMDRGAWWATVHGFTNSWTQLSYWTCTYNKAGPSEKHWPIFRWWSLLYGKSCILVLEKSILMQLNLSHTIINSKSWNAKKYMVVLTPTVSIHLWKLTSVKIKSFLITDTV